ncbi:MAG TPA: carbon-nitrogen hydrolase family protein [Burkholderiales bacterium]|nr:carbon-nitrogen hydrolase family protein [Burkholderiales bacterium]
MTPSAPFRVALVQMVSTPSVAENLEAAQKLIAQAAAQGAKLVALPEYFCILGVRDTDKVAAKEKDGAGPIQEFLAASAKRHGIWLVGGSVPLECSDPGKVRNSCLIYDSEGGRVARYDKIHLFGLELGAERFDEGRTIEAGTAPCAIDSPFGRIAVSVCYDVRFPELYRALAPMDIILVPSAFTATTGRAHWETLLRSRAIENLAWVLAPAQGGTHASGRQTHGHSMVVDPWGKVVAERATGAGVVVADIDPMFQAKMRRSLPALTHRVLQGPRG